VRTACDGTAALELAEEFRPDVLLLDIGMPKLDGFEVARRIRQQPWGRQIVLAALTGWGQEEDKRRTRAAGFDHHFVKPVEPAVLQRFLAECEPSVL
jgi:CheY-like chemotaxis protein